MTGDRSIRDLAVAPIERLITLDQAIERAALRLYDANEGTESDAFLDDVSARAAHEPGLRDGPSELVLQLIGIELSERS